MKKTITISAPTMMAILQGKRIRVPSVNLSPAARLGLMRQNPQTQEFSVEIIDPAFDNPEIRLPQEFRIETER